MKSIIFLGAPASGKGTHSSLLAENLGYIQISTGNLLREISTQNTELGQKIKNIIASGELVDDESVLSLLKNKLNDIAGKPFILDGFPRNLNQTKQLSVILDDLKVEYIVIYFNIDEDLCRKRITGRITCPCGKSYNMTTKFLPKKEGICDSCGQSLQKREDDNEEAFNKRFALYIKNTEPIIDYYQKENKLVVIDANTTETRSCEDIYQEIIEVINDKY